MCNLGKGVNLAYRKRAKMSSQYSGRYSAAKAVDGNLNTLAHSRGQNNPWWQVDLGRKYLIQRVQIYNRRNCCGMCLSNLISMFILITNDYNRVGYVQICFFMTCQKC